jgi:hypothetical protein
VDSFVPALRIFIARHGKPKIIWSDHGINFVGAKTISSLKELGQFLNDQQVQDQVPKFCTIQYSNTEWKFIPEKIPHIGGLWESAVKA